MKTRVNARRGLRTAIVAALAIAGATIAADGYAAAGTSNIRMTGCYETVHFMKEPDAERIAAYLPDGYRLGFTPPFGPDAASIAPWIFACDGVDIEGRPIGAAMLSLIAIQIDDDAVRMLSPSTHWDNYAVWAHTDNPHLANTLRDGGFSVDLVDEMEFDRTEAAGFEGAEFTKVEVPWGPSPYEVTVDPTHHTDTPHAHGLTFQHGPVDQKSILRVDVPPVAHDWLCTSALTPNCATVSASNDGSKLDVFFGDATVELAADHYKLPEVNMTLSER